ncbi:hypothetical protein [Streptomyces broussonetiae]|uniref:Uncharacterized protein n=1 Tax=Streptomyces broussonetiae TaxID=2686304 RepID=A0A6I6N512_9ACTN|nr:hypothetical protein [Streptomyces broussonetiae]QHA03767.1 hypothetical protein GQF42_11210 [Streptomyces broussonetiae]
MRPTTARLARVRGRSVRPDLASVNRHEPGAEAVAEQLPDLGVGVAAGIRSRRRGCGPVRARIGLEDTLPLLDGQRACGEGKLAREGLVQRARSLRLRAGRDHEGSSRQSAGSTRLGPGQWDAMKHA